MAPVVFINRSFKVFETANPSHLKSLSDLDVILKYVLKNFCPGIASLSMHSIRETIGCDDIETNVKLFTTFYSGFGELDKSCSFN